MAGKSRRLIQTHRKLGETEFFLARLREFEGRTAAKDPEVFGYYLSAFLAAARSVVDVLIYENGNTNCFKRWRSHLSQEDQELFTFLQNERNSEIHRKGAKYRVVSKTKRKYYYPSVHALPMSMLFSDVKFEPDGAVCVVTHLPERHFKIRERRLKVIESCGRHVGLLKDLVASCEKQSE